MSAHAAKGIRFVPKMPPLLGHAPSFSCHAGARDLARRELASCGSGASVTWFLRPMIMQYRQVSAWWMQISAGVVYVLPDTFRNQLEGWNDG
jgi:hypothetical protein